MCSHPNGCPFVLISEMSESSPVEIAWSVFLPVLVCESGIHLSSLDDFSYMLIATLQL